MRATTMRQELELILADENLSRDMEILPKNYSFEVPKTIWKIRSTGSRVALQLPEGLLLYACLLSDILVKYTGCEIVIMGDVTYGACCVDDYTAKALGCDLLVHYGHSCLVPIQDTSGIHLLYIFVNININLSNFVDTMLHNFKKNQRIAFISTVQFLTSLHAAKTELVKMGFESIYIPQCSPLSPGEVLGCTSPKLLDNTDCLVYLGDGRFHLESAMIQNPTVSAYQYNPYSRVLTQEEYAFDSMVCNRKNAINIARDSDVVGLIQGTLGRQGNSKIFENLESKLKERGKKFLRVLISEIFVGKLNCFDFVQSWVQVACPRLSIDWGTMFKRPLLTPYEMMAALNFTHFDEKNYPMDFYAYDSRGPWTNNHESHRPRRPKRPHIVVQS